MSAQALIPSRIYDLQGDTSTTEDMESMPTGEHNNIANRSMTHIVLSAYANVPTLDGTENDDSERTSADIDVRDLDAPENFDRYITGEEKFCPYHICMKSSDSSQTLWSNVQQPMSKTKLSLASSSLFLDSRTRSAKF